MMNEASLIMESLTGGADGPTSVFVALPKELEMIILIAALVIGVVFCLFGQKIIRVIGVVTGLLTGAVLGTVAAVVFGLSGGALWDVLQESVCFLLFCLEYSERRESFGLYWF